MSNPPSFNFPPLPTVDLSLSLSLSHQFFLMCVILLNNKCHIQLQDVSHTKTTQNFLPLPPATLVVSGWNLAAYIFFAILDVTILGEC